MDVTRSRPVAWRWIGKSIVVAVLVLATQACSPETQPVTTRFTLHPPPSLAPTASPPTLRFYVSDLRMVDAHGQATRVRLTRAPPHQDERTALVSLVAEGPAGNAVVHGSVTRGDYVHMEFLLGVPFARNHGNPLQAEPPLDRPVMFWAWQSGRKFLRLELDNAWSFHLGSTGCHSASAVRPPQDECRRPNLARIRLPASAAADGQIDVDLGALIAPVNPTVDANCMGSYADDETCRRVLDALGLDAETGRCLADCRGQRVFRVARR